MGIVCCRLISLGRATDVRDIDRGVYFLCVLLLLLLLGRSNYRCHRQRRGRLLYVLCWVAQNYVACRRKRFFPHHETRCALDFPPPQRGRGQGGPRQDVENIDVWSISIPAAGVCQRWGASNFCFCFVTQKPSRGRVYYVPGCIQCWLVVVFNEKIGTLAPCDGARRGVGVSFRRMVLEATVYLLRRPDRQPLTGIARAGSGCGLRPSFGGTSPG